MNREAWGYVLLGAFLILLGVYLLLTVMDPEFWRQILTGMDGGEFVNTTMG